MKELKTEVEVTIRQRDAQGNICGAATRKTFSTAGYVGLSQRKALCEGALDAAKDVVQAHFSDKTKDTSEAAE